jgi:predicted transcriptional regulator
MAVVRKSISLPPALAAKLDAAARERGRSVSDIVAQALKKDLEPEAPWRLPADSLFDGPAEPLGRTLDERLAETWADDIARDR